MKGLELAHYNAKQALKEARQQKLIWDTKVSERQEYVNELESQINEEKKGQ